MIKTRSHWKYQVYILINHTKKSSLQFSIDQSQKETKAVTTMEYNAEEPEKYFEKTIRDYLAFRISVLEEEKNKNE